MNSLPNISELLELWPLWIILVALCTLYVYAKMRERHQRILWQRHVAQRTRERRFIRFGKN